MNSTFLPSPPLFPAYLLGTLALLCAQSLALHAQSSPTADQLLTEVRANMQAYVATLPDLFCDERFTSQRFADGHQTDAHTTLSTFRVQRGAGPRRPGESREFRTVREIDGAPAHGNRIKGPYTFEEGFDAAPRLFTEAFDCYTFALAPASDASRIHLTFVAKSTLPSTCHASDLGRTGDLTLDAASHQLLEIRQTVPHPPGGGDKWVRLVWTVTFAPVTLGSKSFYTPASVRSEIFRAGSSESMQSLADYTHYHQLTVTSTILPTEPGANQPQ